MALSKETFATLNRQRNKFGRFVNLYSEDFALNELKKRAEQLGYSPSAGEIDKNVKHACWRRFGNLNNARKMLGLETYNSSQKLSPKLVVSLPLTEDLSYVLGTICGDGNICYLPNKPTRYSISLGAIDKEFVLFFKNSIEQMSGLKARFYSHLPKNRKNLMYIAIIYSKFFVKKMMAILPYNKTENWRIPKRIFRANEKIRCAFVRGFADSEGCVRPRQVILTSINLTGLKDMAILLFNLGIDTTLKHSRDNCFVLKINGFGNLKKFSEKIGFVIKRKQEKLIRILNNYEAIQA